VNGNGNSNGNGFRFPLFYEDVYDALNRTVTANPKGLSMKQIAADTWPARNPDTARSVLSRAINPESHDHNLAPDEMVRIMRVTEVPEHVIFFLCDEFGFDRPARKDKTTFERAVKSQLKNIQDQVSVLMREMKNWKE
jgi:hypothetical protein